MKILNRKGFSLAELIVVIAIICILATVFLINYKGKCVQAKVTGVVADVSFVAESEWAGKVIKHRTFTAVKFKDGKVMIFTGHYNSLIIGKETEITYEYYPDTTADKNTGDILAVKLLGKCKKGENICTISLSAHCL